MTVSSSHSSDSSLARAPATAPAPAPAPAPRPWLLTVSFGFLVWTLLGVSFALSAYLNAVRDNASISFKRTLSGYLADFWLWGMLSPLIFRLATRYELRNRFPRNLFI